MAVVVSTAKAIVKTLDAARKGAQQLASVAKETGLDKAAGVAADTTLYALTMPGEQVAKQVKLQGAKLQHAGKQSMSSGARFDPVTKTFHE